MKLIKLLLIFAICYCINKILLCELFRSMCIVPFSRANLFNTPVSTSSTKFANWKTIFMEKVIFYECIGTRFTILECL